MTFQPGLPLTNDEGAQPTHASNAAATKTIFRTPCFPFIATSPFLLIAKMLCYSVYPDQIVNSADLFASK
jgi:hypothetical protein